MPETPEIPEAKDPFEKRIAISIALMAVALSVISNQSDNARTEAILKSSEATDKWGWYQSKSIKGHMVELEQDLIELQTSAPADKVDKRKQELKAKFAKYEGEKETLFDKATDLDKEAKHNNEINDRYDKGALLLQIAVVLSSVAILGRWHPIWFVGIVLALAGAAVGVSALAM